MEKQKYTPGPWRLRKCVNGIYAVYGQGEYDLIFPHTTAGIDDNARLLVSAPELIAERDEAVELLKEIVVAADNLDSDEEWPIEVGVKLLKATTFLNKISA